MHQSFTLLLWPSSCTLSGNSSRHRYTNVFATCTITPLSSHYPSLAGRCAHLTCRFLVSQRRRQVSFLDPRQGQKRPMGVSRHGHADHGRFRGTCYRSAESLGVYERHAYLAHTGDGVGTGGPVDHLAPPTTLVRQAAIARRLDKRLLDSIIYESYMLEHAPKTKRIRVSREAALATR